VLSALEVTVLVDDYLTEEGADAGALPAHGLCLLLELERCTGERVGLLIDGGPLPELLEHNASSLNADLRGVEAGFATMWSFHHILALLKLARESRFKVHLSPPPKQRVENLEELKDYSAVAVSLHSPAYNERALLLRLERGLVAVVGCSVYGVDETLHRLTLAEERLGAKVEALVGGFNLSTYDAYGLRLLTKFARKRGATLMPLHSTSLEARERICREFRAEEIPGVGTRAVFE